ncbi:MAG: helix-turn-helix transcriptional regulator [Sphingomonadales bacterium]|nr:helix-turn-helix transcriptional regulator [Sphingomonadales bacterium]
MMQETLPSLCPVGQVMGLIGAKWASAILWHLFDRPLRFGTLRRMLPEASPKILTTRLRELEQAGLIDRVILSDRPFAVEYRITPKGQTLRPIFQDLTDWGVVHVLTPEERSAFAALGGRSLR